MNNRIFFLSVLAAVVPVNAKNFSISSPDGKNTVVVSDAGGLMFSIRHSGTLLLQPSSIGLDVEGIKEWKIKGSSKERAKGSIDAPFWRQPTVTYSYNELILTLNDRFTLTFRVFDDGVAYRFGTTRKGETIVRNETARYVVGGDTRCWLPYSTTPDKPFAMAFQNIYDVTTISRAKSTPAFLPVTVGEKTKITLTESDLVSYPGMFVTADGDALKGVFAHYPKEMEYYPWRHMTHVKTTENYIARSSGARSYPWRILAISDNDMQMPVNDLVYILARPNMIGDISWIKPGKVAWDWWNDWMLKGVPFRSGINFDTYKYFIDFASDYDIEYIVLDEGWYDSKSGDVMTPVDAVRLPELISYAKKKGIGIVLWSVFNVMDENLETITSHYADMGISGFKVDFMDRDDQTAVEMVERLAEACARHHLLLDLHGIYKPVGLNRTYPNILNYESVFGMEEARWTKKESDMPLYDVTFPYIRSMAGQVDFTPGAMRNGTKTNWQANYEKPMSMGTRAHQAACYIVQDSPFTMLADSPTNYERDETFTRFITSLPVVFDETRCLDGHIGEYIVMARRKGRSWYIGIQTNWETRYIKLPLSFLEAGNYDATLLTDGVNADRDAEDYTLTRSKEVMTANDTIDIHLAPGGGAVIKLLQSSI